MVSRRKKLGPQVQVWVGYSDDEPHEFDSEFDGRHIAVYLTRKEARKFYEDVRPHMLTRIKGRA